MTIIKSSIHHEIQSLKNVRFLQFAPVVLAGNLSSHAQTAEKLTYYCSAQEDWCQLMVTGFEEAIYPSKSDARLNLFIAGPAFPKACHVSSATSLIQQEPIDDHDHTREAVPLGAAS